MIRALIITAALIASPALANHAPGHVVVPKKAVDVKNWKPPLEIQNKGGNAVVTAPVKK